MTFPPEVVVVTGATSGVGRAIARRFAEEGAAGIALLARSSEALEGARREIEAAGARALPLPTDIADPERVEAAAQAVEDTLGTIDVWINNAMTTIFAWFEDVKPEEYRRATEVTYHGFVCGTRSALRRM